jgi:hypothetical protein
MIRADWTPLWAADPSNGKALGAKQVRCLELLREHGPLTHTELRGEWISISVLDGLLHTWPALVDLDHADQRRYRLAAPRQLRELGAVLEAIRMNEVPPVTRYSGAATDHLMNAGVIRVSQLKAVLLDPPWVVHSYIADIPKRSRWPQPGVPASFAVPERKPVGDSLYRHPAHP